MDNPILESSETSRGHWPLAPADLSLAADEIHVWTASIDIASPGLAELESTLVEEERARAARFRFDLHRNRFIAGRGFLRTILGRYLAIAPAELEFSYGPNGKPSLSPAYVAAPLPFNLAHSEGLALLAITRLGQIGADVELVKRIDDAQELVSRFFSARENALFQKLSTDQQPQAFFNLWTRKEAWLKATGEGIGHSLNRVEVSFLPGEPARLLALPDGHAKGDRWSLISLDPGPPFVAAVATTIQDPKLKCWRWTNPVTSQACAQNGSFEPPQTFRL
jgi:4'-phosphopantetheinyl transferase